MEALGIGIDELVAKSGLDAKIVRAIASGNYTPSPSQRMRLAVAMAVPLEEIAWDHAVPVDHMYGHGPQFGRSP